MKVNVLGILACAENMPSGSAQRPGDIVTAANGKTIEVVNTDAEGRMVLADAVWYAGEKGATEVVDIATLTGAVIIALGEDISGIVANDDNLAMAVKLAGHRAGEEWWQLPSWKMPTNSWPVPAPTIRTAPDVRPERLRAAPLLGTS